MKKALLFFVLAVFSYQIMKAQDANKPFVHCLVLDRTASMEGHIAKGVYVPEDNIWDDVKKYCKEWVDGIPEFSTVLFFTFDEKLSAPKSLEIKTENDKESVKQAIESTQAKGPRTCIASCLQKVINYLTENYPDTIYNRGIYLITDGKDEDKVCRFSDVVKEYDGWRGDYDYLYYVDLKGKIDPKDKKYIEDAGGIVGDGFHRFVTLSPVYDTIPYILGVQKYLEQRFVVSSGKLSDGLIFDVKVKSGYVDISPSKISVDNLKKIEEGKYKFEFDLEFAGNSEKECDIDVVLKGCNNGENTLVLQPSGFCIQARNKTKGKLLIKEGNSGKKGWN